MDIDFRRTWLFHTLRIRVYWQKQVNVIRDTTPAHKIQGCGHSSKLLTHWGRVTHICVSKLTIIGSDNGLSPGRRQAIIWTNAGILLIRTLGTNFSEILGEINSFSFSKMHLKMSSAKWRLFGLGLNELTHWGLKKTAANLQTTFSNAFSCMKMKEFWLTFNWSQLQSRIDS